MTPQELRASIIQQAIQGKLVEQRPNEGTGEELFQQIQAEKQALIKADKIKKEKPLAKISEEEIPFEIPDTWRWARWGDLSQSIQYGYNAAAQENGRIKMVRISDIQNGKVMWETVPYCDIAEDDISSYLIAVNDILFARTGGTVGKSYLVKDVPEDAVYAGYLIRTQYSSLLCPEYMKYFMDSKLYWDQLRNGTIATAQPNCNGKTLAKMILPLPSQAEQKRIVAKLEEILPLIDRYEAAWNKLEEFNKRFPVDMQKSILQMAIQGKLVPQIPEEGTGEDMFRQIQTERQAMIKAGKIKKGKAYPAIDEGEIPFAIPETWIWVRLQDLVYNRGQKVPNKTFCYIDIGSIDNKRQKLNPEDKFIEANKAPSRARKIVQMGDILYSTVRPYLHNMCIIDREFGLEPIASTGFAAMTCFEGINNKYLFYYLLSPSFDSYANDTENAKGVAYPAINDDRLYRAVVPVPPFAEQKRIVAKLEEILPLCERLK